MKNRFAEVGGKVVAEIPFSENLDSTINQVKEKSADVII